MSHIIMTLIGNIQYDGRVRKEIATLRDAGHRVELIVSDFSGKQSGQQGLNIPIHFIPITMRTSALGNFLEQLRFNLRASRLIKELSPDFIHCHDLTALLAGTLAHRKVNCHLIFDAHELLPESMGGIKEKIWERIERFCVKQVDTVIMPEVNRIRYFQNKYPGLKDIRLLENFPRQADLPQANSGYLRQRFPIPSENKIILHTGAVAPARHIEEIIDAVAMCPANISAVILGLTFKGYDSHVQDKIVALGLQDRVFLHGPVPHSEMLNIMSSCDIGTAFYRNSNLNNYYCASNKLYECISLGKAVVTNDYPGLIEVVQNNKLGVCVKEMTPQALAVAFLEAADDDNLQLGAKSYFWESQASVLTDIYGDPND